MRIFAEGKADAILGFPPQPQLLRAHKIGHVIVNTGADRPWSQYFCCMLLGNSEFVQQNPVATQARGTGDSEGFRHVRPEPERAARLIVDRGLRVTTTKSRWKS